MDDNSGKLTVDAKERKDIPMARGLLDYFPDALVEVAHLSQVGNEQHNPGQELHWAREKSTDHADCILRHLIDRGKLDGDGIRHTAKVAWRALALLQIEIEEGKDEMLIDLENMDAFQEGKKRGIEIGKAMMIQQARPGPSLGDRRYDAIPCL